jgi:hypothetical protein
MGVKRKKKALAIWKSPIQKFADRVKGLSAQRGDELHPAKALSKGSIVRLANHILNSNRHLDSFEVELGDEETCSSVAREFEVSGCKVEREPFRYFLRVACPRDLGFKKSA